MTMPEYALIYDIRQGSEYSRRPLLRTRKGAEILFEIANVRNNQSFENLTKIR